MLHPEAPSFFRIVLGIHIAAGTLALFAVPVALAVKKGGLTHRRFGIVYVYSMFAVAVTALLCAPYFRDYFLMLIAVFASYLTFVGWRTLKRKDPARQGPAAIDWAAAGAALAAGLGLEAMAALEHAYFRSFAIVLVIFGAICLGAGARSVYFFRNPPKLRGAWLFEHFGMMLGAYIATVSAFSAVNFHFVHPLWLRWLWPTIVGTLVIAAYSRKYRIRFAKAPASAAELPIAG